MSKEIELSRIVVMNHVTLDGVMQAPGRPEEDTRDGFSFGGWANLSDTANQAVGQAMGERMSAGGGLAGWLFGRRTYDDLLGYWNQREDSPFGAMLKNAPKYIVSSSLQEPPPWPNSTVLRGDVIEAVRTLKVEKDGVLGIMGSGQLIGSLMAGGLIDEYLLIVHPLVLGAGRRLFPEGIHASLHLAASVTTETGVLISTYEPARSHV